MQRIRGCGIPSVGGEDNKDDDQRIDPCVLEGEILPAAEQRAGLAPLGCSRDRSGRGALEDVVSNTSSLRRARRSYGR